VKAGCSHFNGFAPVSEKVKRERFQRDFEEALKAFEYQSKNPGAVALNEQRKTLETLSEADSLSENRLMFLSDGKKPRLALKSERPTQLGFSPRQDRIMVNGIDITEMRLNGKPLSLDDFANLKKEIIHIK